jgi:citrate synthase
VEFFTAILLDALKIPRQAFTPIFAVRAPPAGPRMPASSSAAAG